VSTRIGQAIGIGCALALSACSRPAAPPPVAEADGGIDPALVDVSPRTQALALQAERDVAALQALGQAQAQAQAQAETPPAEAPPRTRPEVQWILPQAQRSGSEAGQEPAAAAAPRPADDPADGQASLARDRPLPVEVPEEEPGGADAVTQPDPNGSDRLNQLIVDLSSELYRRGAYSDMPLRELLLIAATTMVTPDRALATDALPGVTQREREILGQWQAFCARIGPRLAETGDPEILVAEIEALHQALVREPPLVVAQAALCTRVRGFGDYDEFSRNAAGRYAFLALSGQQAVVYVEVENFTSELNESGQWVTKLSQQLEVLSERDGIPVWREDWQAGVDLSRKRREDFFIVQVVTLPQRLAVGRYNLKIRIRDDRSGAEAEAAVDFDMLADPRMTSDT
jgi:hypothetical protein